MNNFAAVRIDDRLIHGQIVATWISALGVNAIIVAVSRKKGADVAQTFSQLEKIWEEYKVYEINDD